MFPFFLQPDSPYGNHLQTARRRPRPWSAVVNAGRLRRIEPEPRDAREAIGRHQQHGEVEPGDGFCLGQQL